MVSLEAIEGSFLWPRARQLSIAMISNLISQTACSHWQAAKSHTEITDATHYQVASTEARGLPFACDLCYFRAPQDYVILAHKRQHHRQSYREELLRNQERMRTNEHGANGAANQIVR